MKLNRSLYPLISLSFSILFFILPLIDARLAIGATPHLIYCKAFNHDNTVPAEDGLLMYGYCLDRPGEVLNISSVGCGYEVLGGEGWLWLEAGNYVNAWSIGEKLRVVLINPSEGQTKAVDVVLDGSGAQHVGDLNLEEGDKVGPRAYNVLAENSSPAVINLGTLAMEVSASIDDSIAGSSNIESAEYFVDADPGLGSGLPMNALDGAFNSASENVTASVNVSSWGAGSTHVVYVRGRDAAGNWGTTHRVTVSMGLVLAGDVNGDNTVGVADIFYLINHLLAGGPAPLGDADVNNDGQVNTADIEYLIDYFFAGGPPPM